LTEAHRDTLKGVQRSLNLVDLQNLVAIVVDHLDRDLAGVWLWEGPALRAIERRPRRLVDLGAQGSLELVVGIAIPGQDAESRVRRGRGIAATRTELERWRAEHPGAEADPEEFRAQILPALASVRLTAIMAAVGCAKSTASMIRSGRHVPALRHWASLAKLPQLAEVVGE